MISFDKMRPLLKKKGLMFIDLKKQLGLSSTLVAKFQKNRTVTTETIDKVCTFLECQPGDIMEWIPDEKIVKKMKLEKQIAELQEKLKQIEEE